MANAEYRIYCAHCGAIIEGVPLYHDYETGVGLSTELYEFGCSQCHKSTYVDVYEVKNG